MIYFIISIFFHIMSIIFDNITVIGSYSFALILSTCFLILSTYLIIILFLKKRYFLCVLSLIIAFDSWYIAKDIIDRLDSL